MKTKLLSLITVLMFFFSHSQTGIPVPEMTNCDTEMMNFMSTFNIPSATFAMTKDGKLIFSRAYGNADIAGTVPTQPYNMFRVASVSKPITAIGIMKMVDDGLINLNDQVFGTGGLLENHWYFSIANITDPRVYDITVQMLLEHNAGWDRDVNCFPNPTSPYPWFFSGCDPIAVPLHVTQTFGESNPAKEEHLIRYVLEKNLDHDPGTTYAYSNMGYLVLSEIIEEISGMDYEAWMQQEILHPLGIYDMHIGKNLLVDKQEREGEYVGNGYTTLDVYGNGTIVPWEYGGFSVEIMDGHGGWIATARDLLRLLVAADGFTTKPDILSSSAITTMTTPSAPFSNYAKGWQVNIYNNWWHSGAVDGTASYYVRTSGGYTWAIILNKRIVDGNANNFWAQLDALGWNCISGVSTFPTHDLFDAPTVQTSSLQATNIMSDSMDLSWANGNGENRVVVVKELSGTAQAYNFSAYPLDGTDYTADNTFGLGDALSDGSYVVYNGTGTSMNLQGLSDGTEYAIRVYEYNKNSNNGNHALYLLGNPDELVQATTTLSVEDNMLETLVDVYPNPVKDNLQIKVNGVVKLSSLQVLDFNGRIVMEQPLSSNQMTFTVPMHQLQSGLYILKITDDTGASLTKKISKN